MEAAGLHLQGDAMEDEYGALDTSGETWSPADLALECGRTLARPRVRYRTYGALDGARGNCVVVCHALTGNADVGSWWGELVGPGRPVDTGEYFVVCANALGGCYGTCGPTSEDPGSSRPYGPDFPVVTVRDSVRLHMRLVTEALGVRSVACVVGGSMGGMQALEWLCLGGALVRSAVVMSCGARHHAWQIAISEAQRAAICADPRFRGGRYAPELPPEAGLGVARQMAMITYRSHTAYSDKFGRQRQVRPAGGASQGEGRRHAEGVGDDGVFAVESYLRHQGAKFNERNFDALSYIRLTQLMDSHDVGRGRGGADKALAGVRRPVLIVAVSSDVLYPPSEQRELAELLPDASLLEVQSENGHDGFLLDNDQIAPQLRLFLARHAAAPRARL